MPANQLRARARRRLRSFAVALVAAALTVGMAAAAADPAVAAGAAAGKKPVASRTAPTKPVAKKPVAKKPVAKKPVAKKPVAVACAPTGKKPAVEKPVTKRPAVKKPAVEKPVAKKPAVKKPSTRKTATTKTATTKPAARKPVAKKPAARKPAARKPVPCTRKKPAPGVAALPSPAGANLPQPGPVTVPADAPMVPSTLPLGRTAESYFGIHVWAPGAASSWPGAASQGAVASVRLWDTSTAWSDLEPRPGVFDWVRLDVAVDAALAHGSAPLLVLGQTPTWASSDPTVPGFLQPGGSVLPADMATWRAYVTAVATRYAGRIAAYEIWNEPDYVGDYFHGTEADMAELSSQAYDAVKAADPRALVVSPGMATRTKGQLGWVYRYFDLPKARKIDAISLHLYPRANQLPEDAVDQLSAVATSLALRGLRKPVWNTEVNYGVVGGTANAIEIPEPLGSAFVARTLLMDRAAGVDRVFWYAWASSRLLGIGVTEHDGVQTPAAHAWTTVSRWLMRSTLVGCTEVDDVHACTLRPDAGGWGQILWREAGTSGVRAPADTSATVTLAGDVTARDGGQRIAVDTSPLLVLGGGATVASVG